MPEYYENTEWGHGDVPLMGTKLNNKQHGGLYARYSVEKPENKQWDASTSKGYHEVTVHDKDHDEVGRLEWHGGTGEILKVSVSEDYRRQGVATAMHSLAHKLSNQYGLPKPRHSNDRTDMGDSWAMKVGGTVPPNIKDDPEFQRRRNEFLERERNRPDFRQGS
jgi:GNAT superfamily N-acetyltransferase